MIVVFARYAAVGVVGTLAHYAVLLGLVEIGHFTPTVGTTLGFATGAGVNYVLNYRLTFRSSQVHHVALARFVAVAGMGMLLNWFIVTVGILWLRVHYLIPQVAATGLILTVTFFLNRAWTFRVKQL